MFEYAARLVQVIDANTVILDVDFGLPVWVYGLCIRVASIEAPEMPTEAGLAAKIWAQAWFTEHCPDGMLAVRTVKDKAGMYYLGTITAPDGACLNTELLTAGQAVVYAPRQR
jgi:endonuclease YncB( thermonuclease family)